MTGGSGKMQNHWTKDDVAAAWQRFERTYAHDPVAYRFLCGHCIQDETDEDALDLFGRNINAIDNSPHRYGTTFDISWKRFYPIDADSVNQVLPDRLKLVLAQVLFDLKNQQRCYVKHERKQACFHIGSIPQQPL